MAVEVTLGLLVAYEALGAEVLDALELGVVASLGSSHGDGGEGEGEDGLGEHREG